MTMTTFSESKIKWIKNYNRKSSRFTTRLLLFCWIIFALPSVYAWGAQDSSAPNWSTRRDAAEFDRHSLSDRAMATRIRQSRSLAGTIGWVEYDFSVPATEWYEIVIDGSGHDSEFFLTGQVPGIRSTYLAGSKGFDGKTDKLGNFFLEKGKHTFRIQRHFWTGFPAITGFAVRTSNGSISTRIRTYLPGEKKVFRLGECSKLEVQYGPVSQPTSIPIQVVETTTSKTFSSSILKLPASVKTTSQQWTVPCDVEGRFVLYFNDGGKTLSNRDVHQIEYEVIDTRQRTAAFSPIARTLVQTIDCVIEPPRYAAGITRITQKTFGSYRESDDNGWLDQNRISILPNEPSWFAYELKHIKAQQPHVVEIDYPDDIERTFAIALRESVPLSYPVAGGIDSGGEFLLSQKMQTHTLLFWPRADNTRIVFLPARNGVRAAAARIRVYRIDGELPALPISAHAGRQFVNWYEEGSNFLSMYGAPDEGPHGTGIALDRWASAAAYMGVDTLVPTAVIYSFAQYPSRYHVTFSQPWTSDTLRRLMLIAEKRGLRVLPELHPRADELARLFPDASDPKPNLLVSREGKTMKDLPPLFNPLHPANQEWYLGAVGELAEKYADSPALVGISLRMMQWKNPALHNFHSLDWGYDDYTISLFEKETGIRIPITELGPGRFKARYQWLVSNTQERWISWRCEKITDLLRRIRDRVRSVRKDLEIHIPVFPMTEAGSAYNKGTGWLREAGIDPALLSKIEGLKLVNALHAYGRRFSAESNALLRNNLIGSQAQRLVSPSGVAPRFLPYAMYFEATEQLLPPELLGFPSTTKRTWMSAVINPAGRNYLERFAVLLADTDAVQLGDGGNAYTIGQPELREFLNEYRRLPAEPFRPRADARNPVAIWELSRSDSNFFYLVNRSPQDAEVTLHLRGQGEVESLSSGKKLVAVGNVLRITLKPFQLLAYRAPPALMISKAGRR